MLAFVAIVLIVGSIQAANDKHPASQLPAPAHPLSKPEPAALIERTDLALDSRQHASIAAIAEKWAVEKARLLRAMSSYTPKQGRADQISTSLEGYSELSKTYDTARSSYWDEAYRQLDRRQQAMVGGGQP